MIRHKLLLLVWRERDHSELPISMQGREDPIVAAELAIHRRRPHRDSGQRRLLTRSPWICLTASSTCISRIRLPNNAVALAGLPM